MTWEEVEDTPGYNVAGILTVVVAFILNILNGNLLHGFPNLTNKLPEMNINDVLTVALSIIAGIYTLLKGYHECLKIIEKKRDMREKQIIQAAIEERTRRAKEELSKSNNDQSGTQREGMGDLEKH